MTSFQLAAADHRMVFRADAEKDEVFELYAIDPTVPGARVKLSGTMPGDRDVQDARVSPDGSLVDVCTGTGKQKSLRDYYDRTAILGPDPRGGAMALLIATEVASGR